MRFIGDHLFRLKDEHGKTTRKLERPMVLSLNYNLLSEPEGRHIPALALRADYYLSALQQLPVINADQSLFLSPRNAYNVSMGPWIVRLDMQSLHTWEAAAIHVLKASHGNCPPYRLAVLTWSLCLLMFSRSTFSTKP